MEFLIFLSWIFFAFAVGMFANIRRNRSGLGWGLLALIISPLFAFILVAVLKELPQSDKAKAIPPDPEAEKTNFYLAMCIVGAALIAIPIMIALATA